MRCLASVWRWRAVVLVVMGVLAGCTVGPDYKRPEVIVPADWRSGPDRGDSLGDLGWWELFEDPALYDLIATAVVANRDLQIAVARVLESRAQLGVTRAAQFPQVNGGASYQYTRPNSENSPFVNGSRSRPFTGDDFETSIDLTFELDLWGRLRRATEAARAELLASEENRRAVLTTLVSDVARTYFDLLELDQELEIARRTLQTRQESLQLQRRRFEQGLSSQLDVDRADAEAAVAAATVPDLERRIAQNENGLSVLLGRNPGPIDRGAPLEGQRLPPEVPAGLPSALLERRPDIRRAEQRLVAANARIGAAKAEYFPQISLTGIFGVESVSLSSLFTGPSRFWSVGPTMTVPIFSAGRIRNAVKGFEAREQQAALQYLQAIQQAFREVEDALVFHRKVRDIRTERERRVTANRRALSLVTLRYEHGLSTQLEVLDIQRELFSAELELASATRDQLTAVVQLYRALGGGWQGQSAPSVSHRSRG